MTHPVVMIVSRHSEPDLTLWSLLWGLCVIGLAWTVVELGKRLRK